MTSIISVNGLRKTYPKSTLPAVDGVTFEVEEGDIFAFLGPNGAGKTTTIKILTTLLHPSGGTVRINGHDPQHDQDAARRSFGIVFQDPSLDDELTAWENMELHGILYHVPKDLRRKRTEELLKVVELWDRRDDYVKQFSGGMKRRLEIARGLLHHPKILFLDEPTIGLDPQTRNHLWSYVIALNKNEGITVFLTTHYMEEAEKVARHIAVIDHGKIVGQGTAQELRERTKTATLEEAFLSLTGSDIREEEANPLDQMRMHRRMHTRR
ncbi:MAG: ATP-binding cassette domain-containing protein [Candidatus Peribacteraceae bacterium]|nr:ATP-binding cassette domain-containing protein [Candidatus Peribacteraceae bacterium]